MKYNVILADPPWHFQTRSKKGEKKSASQYYSTMDLDQICALDVSSIASDNSALFLWCCWPHIFMAERVMQAWGFKYSGLAWEWVKYNEETGKFAFGLGYGTRKNVEPCLLARRGNPKLQSGSIRDILFAKRRQHSQKPYEQYFRIEDMYDGPYVEMFAREGRRRWDVWGDDPGIREGRAPLDTCIGGVPILRSTKPAKRDLRSASDDGLCHEERGRCFTPPAISPDFR